MDGCPWVLLQNALRRGHVLESFFLAQYSFEGLDLRLRRSCICLFLLFGFFPLILAELFGTYD